MRIKAILAISFTIFLFSFLIFFYLKSNPDKNLIEKKKQTKSIAGENIEIV